ncbi:MAG: hypothetical protein IKT25_09835, partial [Firmicutes bacterium]|nr:hypothetical protein [Bacillota bacterium]
MKKRILSMLMAIVMVVTMMPTVVLAEDSSQEEHKHCVCGSTTCSGEGHNPNQVWAAWDGTGTANVLKSKKYVYLSQTTANSSNNYLNLRANNTYGTNEVEYLCLHGNTWNSNETPYAIQIADGNSLTVTDCSKD